MRDVLLAQVKSLAAQVAALEHTILVWLPEPAPVDVPTCPHTETIDVGTFGSVEKQCAMCGQPM